METGRLSQAEELGEQALSKTRGQDLWALNALLSSHLLAGRSAELLACLAKHEERASRVSESSTQPHLARATLHFLRGAAQALRGNYRAVYRGYVDHVGSTLAAVRDGQVGLLQLEVASMMLWQLLLHARSRQGRREEEKEREKEREREKEKEREVLVLLDLLPLWLAALRTSSATAPSLRLCGRLYAALTRRALEPVRGNRERLRAAFLKEKEVEAKKEAGEGEHSRWRWGWNLGKSRSAAAKSEAEGDQVLERTVSAETSRALLDDVAAMDELLAPQRDPSRGGGSGGGGCEHLRSVRAQFQLVPSSSAVIAPSQRAFIEPRGGGEEEYDRTAAGLVAFIDGAYAESAALLTPYPSPSGLRGLSSVQSDLLIRQTHLEA
jgi:hypothetical protein